MCEFPSWITTDDGTVLFLEDKDLDNPALKDLTPDGVVGHSAIRAVYPGCGGADGELWPCPDEVEAAVQAGRMGRMQEAAGVRVFFPKDGATINPKRGETYLVKAGTVTVESQSGGHCWACSGGTINASSQSGGYCRAGSGGTINRIEADNGK